MTNLNMFMLGMTTAVAILILTQVVNQNIQKHHKKILEQQREVIREELSSSNRNRYRYRTRDTVEAVKFEEGRTDYPQWFKDAIQRGRIKVNLSIAGQSTLTIMKYREENDDMIAYNGYYVVYSGVLGRLEVWPYEAFNNSFDKVGE